MAVSPDTPAAIAFASRQGTIVWSLPQMPAAKSQSRGLLLIAAFKLLKASALIAVGIGALHLLHKNVAEVADAWVNAFRVDTHNRLINWLLTKLSNVDDRRLKELSIGTFFYAAVFLTEGTGLALRRRWAEYFTSFTTASFLPLEFYEIFKHATVAKVAALLINIAVLVYLIWEIRRHPVPAETPQSPRSQQGGAASATPEPRRPARELE
jgi:uncharacterized membrane protein (DUF2068 family)